MTILGSTVTKKILVTGGSGFIGSALVDYFCSEKELVRIFCRNNSKIDHLPDNIEVFRGDISNKDDVEKALAGVDSVYHCAGAMTGEWEDFYRTNILGTKNLIEALKESSVSKFIYLSSLSIIGYNLMADGGVVDENSPLETEPQNRGYYTMAKMEAEKLVSEAAGLYSELSTIIVRPGLVYGKRWNQNISNIGKKKGPFVLVFGKGNNYLGIIFIGNLVEALYRVLKTKLDNGVTLHLVDPDQPTIREYLEAHNKHSSNWVIPIFIPTGCWRLILSLTDKFFDLLFRKKTTFSYKFSQFSKKLFFNANLAQEKLNWTPKYDFNDAMKLTYS